MSQDYDVFVVQHDPYKLTHFSTQRAANGHAAMERAIAEEEEDIREHGGAGLKPCDLVAYPTWAAYRTHHPGTPGGSPIT